MNISVLCTNQHHPVNEWLQRWQTLHQANHQIAICRDRNELCGGDLLFLVSCSQIIDARIRAKYRNTFVLHASDLPKGRGWSPYIWELLEGAETITVSLISAEDGVDTGAVWAKRSFYVPKDALYDEIHELLFNTELALMDEALMLVEHNAAPHHQSNDIEPTYYPKRSPADSEIDPTQSLSLLFNTIRVMDPQRYPAFFRLHGHTFTIEVKKVISDEYDKY